MSRSTDDAAWAQLFSVVDGQLELLASTGTRPGVDVNGLKAQCLDLVLEAVGAQAQRLSSSPDASAPLKERATALAGRLAAQQKQHADVRMHLIELSEDWQCGTCGRDVASGARVTQRSPLSAELVCKSCGAKTPLKAQGQQRLQQRFGALATPAWNPADNGFTP